MAISDDDGDLLFIGPGFTNDEIDQLFKDLYQLLLQYTKSIFNVVERLCPRVEDQIRLALNIAETDGNLLPCLVAKECEKRKALMKITDEAKERYQPVSKTPFPVQQLQEFMHSEPSILEKKGQT
jgi:hypothetical protein